MRLPAPGTDPDGIVRYIDRLIEESENDPNRQDWLDEAEDNLNFYLGKQFRYAAPEGIERVVLNRVQNIVISMVASQAAEPPVVNFNPRETGEPPITFFNYQSADAERVAQALGGVPDINQPLPPEMAQQIQLIIDQSFIPPMPGMPAAPPIKQDVLLEVTDQTTAEALQLIFDGMWQESNCQLAFVENTVNRNIFGLQPTLYEFDRAEKRHILRNTQPRQVFIDPLNTDVTKWHYAVYDEAVSIEEAKTRWPKLAKELEAAANQGTIQPAGGASYTQSAAYQNNFSRDMVSVRTAWVRYEPYPVDPDRAIEEEMIRAEEVATGEYEDVADPTGMIVGQRPITRTGYFSAAGEEITPDHPAWPMRRGIRQITVVGQFLADDHECEYFDIPLPSNRNIPIPNSPYGQGEPKRLETLQTAINRLLTGYVTWHRYATFPPEFIPKSIADSLGESLRKARTKPGQRIPIPDDLLRMVNYDLNKVIGYPETAKMPTDFWQLLNLLITLIDREGNQAEVAEGNAASGWSGDAIASLQNAHNTIVQGKAIFTEHYLKQIARHMVHSIVNKMEPADWKKYLSKYPTQAIEVLYTRAKSLDIDVEVQIRSGSGNTRAMETQQLIAAKQAGAPISDPEIVERLGVDPDTQLTRQLDWDKKKLRASQGNQPLAQAANTAVGGPSSGGAAAQATSAQQLTTTTPSQ